MALARDGRSHGSVLTLTLQSAEPNHEARSGHGWSLRSREISIRIALGLPPADAARMILWEGETIAIAGATAGIGIFFLFAKLLGTLAFEVSPADPVTLAAALVIVLIVATLATWIPARRAARIDPAETLKIE